MVSSRILIKIFIVSNPNFLEWEIVLNNYTIK
ncbi:hypothetical protein LMOSLCC2479_2775 [Listeria monocytogenes SLCC2479]|nr:hypothetical protein LMOSLCC2372_2776 [Listeria monocytogenes SLCC2372]CBY59046.1 hypothetical protein LMOSLCC2479_2775 [Listeria monocytogenes SLCC2479]